MSNPFPNTGQNPFAEQLNPYAAPRELAAFEPPSLDAAPFSGLWRQGNLLVMHKAAPFPNICLKSNLPATHRLKRHLYWHHPALFLLILLHVLIYAVVVLIVRKRAKIDIPLTAEWYHRRRVRMIIAWSIVLVCGTLIGVAVYGINQTAPGGDAAWAGFLMITSLLVLLGTAIWGLISCRLVSPKKMTDTYIWLKGVHPEYLDRLETWTWNI